MSSPVRFLRSTGAVIAGYLIFALSAFALFQVAGRAPHAPQPAWFMAVSTIYGMLFAALGGIVAARLAPSRPTAHAIAVGIVIALGATASLITSPGAGATWSQWSAILLMAPCAWLGGRLRRAKANGER